MGILVWLFTIAAGGALLAALAAGRRRAWRVKWLVAAAVCALAAVVALVGSDGGNGAHSPNYSLRDIRPIATAGTNDEYASSSACKDCHAEQYHSWHTSYHRTMTQLATPQTVLGDFDDVQTEAYGHYVALRQEGGEYWVTMHDPEHPVTPTSAVIRRPVVMATGSHHMQVYWYATGRDRRLGQLPLVWLCEAQRWVPIHSIFVRPPQQQAGKNEARWNNTCIKCHTTQGSPRIDLVKRHVDSQVAEFGIACEACHGAGAKHAASHRDAAADVETMVHPTKLDHRRASEICGQCHGVWTARDAHQAEQTLGQGMTYRPGDVLSDTRHVFGSDQEISPHVAAFLRKDPNFLEDRFWSDGMVRVSGREFSGLIRSACFQKGTMSCMSCHALHPGAERVSKEWANDQLAEQHVDQQCLDCHEAYRDPRQLAQHTRHLANSSGSACVNCHMPYTTYGLLKSIRSHEISIPSAHETVATGRPNACNLCHVDQTLPWVARHLQSWFNSSLPEFSPAQRRYSSTLLAALRGDAGQRVLAAATLGWQSAREASRVDWVPPILGQLLVDPYDAVRYVAYRSLKRQAGFQTFEYDFLGSLQDRTARSRAVYSQWQAARQTRRGAPSLLIEEGGDLTHREFIELLQSRDDRVVALAE